MTKSVKVWGKRRKDYEAWERELKKEEVGKDMGESHVKRKMDTWEGKQKKWEMYVQ